MVLQVSQAVLQAIENSEKVCLQGEELVAVQQGIRWSVSREKAEDLAVVKLFNETLKTKLTLGFQEEDKRLVEVAEKLAQRFSVHYVCEKYDNKAQTSSLGEMAALMERYARAAHQALYPEEEINYASKANQALMQKWIDCGFPQEFFYKSPDLVDFVFKNHIHNAISRYSDPLYEDRGHGIKIVDGQPALLFQGEWRPWTEIKRDLPLNPKGELEGWSYTYNTGLQSCDSVQWVDPRQTEPVGKLKIPLDSPRYVIVNSRKLYPQGKFKDRHVSIRIVEADGTIRSFGVGSPGRLQHGGSKTAFATEDGILCAPDDYEICGKVVHDTTEFEITEDQKEQLFAKLEQFKQEGIPFSWLPNDCATFPGRLASELGMDIRIGKTLLLNLLPKKIQKSALATWDKMPKPLRSLLRIAYKIVTLIPNILINTLGLLFFGASQGVVKNGKKIAVIASVKDFFFKELFTIRLPQALYEWQKEVEAWRGSHSLSIPQQKIYVGF